MCTEIYYFSGTGNSLHVAKEMQKRIPKTELIPIISLLDKNIIKTNSKTIGFVFPVHALTIPIAVKKFLRKIDLTSAEYIFALATRASTTHRAFDKIEKMLKKKSKSLDSYFTLNMASNDPKGKDWIPPTDEELVKLESEVDDKLDSIQKIVIKKEKSREKDTKFTIPVNFLLEKFVLSAMTVSEYTGGVNYFCSDSKCTGCGTCEKVCLSGKIKMIDNKPMWQKKVFCYMCYACVNFCPVLAVQINDITFVKSNTRQNKRYPHPYGTVNDIAEQKKN